LIYIQTNMSSIERSKCTIYIGGLDPLVSKENIHGAFLPFGDIIDIIIPTTNSRNDQGDNDEDNTTRGPGHKNRGFAYIEFEEAEDAKEAIDNMDQSELLGRTLRVAQAKPQKDHSEGLGSKTAVWEQVRQIERDWGERLLTFIVCVWLGWLVRKEQSWGGSEYASETRRKLRFDANARSIGRGRTKRELKEWSLGVRV